MNCNNIQSTNFGMAYKITDKKGFIECVNKMSIEDASKLNEQMRSALEKLKSTKYADVETLKIGDKLNHSITYKRPYINEAGNVAYQQCSGTTFQTLFLEKAVADALIQENKMASVDACKKQMAELLNASTKSV